MCAVGGLKGEMKFGGGEAERTEMCCSYPDSSLHPVKKTKKKQIWLIFLNATPPVETKNV